MNLRRPFGYFLVIFSVSFLFGISSVLAQTSAQGATMLLLGSAHPKTLKHRVDVAFRLYNSEIVFDRIIVSGGCGAHSSSICEASRMDSLLILKGIPPEKIFKEEKSKTTKQNYCYSKKLRRNGKLLIRKQAPLYVVSDHWHALSVASCFRKADGVAKASFHIEGTINPKGPADYTHIFKDCTKNNYCRAILWAFVDAAYFDRSNNKLYYFVDNIYYRKTPGHGIDAGYPKKISSYPGWPKGWDDRVDAAYYNTVNHKAYLFQGTEFIIQNAEKALQESRPKKIAAYFGHWPDSWGTGYINAAYYDETQKKVYLFKGSSYVRYGNKHSDVGSPAAIEKEYAKDWPFQWGSGDVDAAYYMPSSLAVTLFRGTDYLRYSPQTGNIDPKYPKPISLPWPKRIWGNRPETN